MTDPSSGWPQTLGSRAGCSFEGKLTLEAAGAIKGYDAMRGETAVAIGVMVAEVEVARAENLLGPAVDMEIRTGAGAYVCGEETSLLNSLEGKRGIVRAKPPLPALEGFMAKPTVVNNVISLASVPVILAKGAKHYKDFGLGRSRGTMPIRSSTTRTSTSRGRSRTTAPNRSAC